MSGKLPQSNGGGMTNGVSRLSQMQAQFQQKQKSEKEAKLLAMLDNQQQRIIQHTNGLLNKYNNNTGTMNLNPPTGPAASATVPPGKVRQMFEERRKGGTVPNSATTPATKGIDKANPLDPIVTPPINKQSRSTSNKPLSSTTNTTPVSKKPPVPAPLPIQRPTNLGSSKKPPSLQQSPVTTPTPTTHSSNSNQNLNSYTPKSSKSMTPTQSLPPSNRNSGVLSRSTGSSVASSASSSRGSKSPTSYMPPVANTTKYSDYANELDRREASLSNKLKGMEISPSSNNNNKKTSAPTKSSSSVIVRKTPSPAAVVGAKSTGGKATPPPRPKGTPPPGHEACSNCGRHFANDRIAKHESICKKVAQKAKKRKTFDPTKMRMQGTEAEPYIRIVSAKPKVAPKAAESGKKKADWRKKHEDFIATIRAAKQYQDHVAKGGDPNDLPPPPASDYSDYVQCPHCKRKFSEQAAERHIPKCSSIKSNKR